MDRSRYGIHQLGNHDVQRIRNSTAGFVSSDLNRYLTFINPQLPEIQRRQELRNMMNQYAVMYTNEVTAAQTNWDQQATARLFVRRQTIPQTEITRIATSQNLNLQEIDNIRQHIANVIPARYPQEREEQLFLRQLDDFVYSLDTGLRYPYVRGNNTEGTAALNVLRNINFDRRIIGRNLALQNLLQRDDQLRNDLTNWFNSLSQAGIDVSRPR